MTASSSPRLHGLDAIRAFALLLGVVLHAAMSFIPGPWGIPIWITVDQQADTAFSLAFYLPHIFRMTLFFLIAGFFARLAYEKRGALGLAIDRFKRITLPLLSFWLPVFVAVVAAIVWGAVKANGGEMPQDEQPPLTVDTFPLTHLWFLYLLTLFYPVAIILRALIRMVDRGDHLGGLMDRVIGLITYTPVGLIVLALPLGLAFMLEPNWMMWFGIPTPDRGLVPNTVALTGYGFAFTVGWLLHRRRDILDRLKTWAPVYALIAVGLTIWCVLQVGLAPSFTAGEDNLETWIYALSYAAAGWAWCFALLGLGLVVFARENTIVRYVADASYWIYILHLPIVMALQVWFSDMAIPVGLKFALVNLITLAVCLASYHVLVRNTVLGGWLNGRRYPGKSKTDGSTAQTSHAE